ncbi:GNAT family N-acetyltransferase [Mesorhizobium sp. ANAO-SY3R2]|uniref:GNAT family N-acetyltransferase n=1 Tax=Mesorhizobium sp. ANAO-SY3R2 TaxID=3166644 RepID=UPI00366AAD80
MTSAPGENDVRLRMMLGAALKAPEWPGGFSMRTLQASDAPALHALWQTAFDDFDQPLDEWWRWLSGDEEFDPALCFLVFDRDGRLAGAAQCWTSAFIKDLAVHPDFRGRGIAEALLRQVFSAFRARGAAHVDLKTNLVDSAAAVRLYRKLGMVEVGWAG